MREQHVGSRIRAGVTVAGGFVLLMTLGTLAATAEEREVEATFYGDNYYEFLVNGELVMVDPRFIPHTAFARTITLRTDRENVFAVYARDNARSDTGLEYGDRCIGDGGFRFRVDDDSVVSSAEWKCKTVFYGPVNPEQCFGLGLDPTGNRGAFGAGSEAMTAALARPTNPIPSCRDDRSVPVTDTETGQDGFFYPEACQMETFDWFAAETALTAEGGIAMRANGRPVRADWAMPGYDDNTWESAVEYTDLVVGWGAQPGTDSGPPWAGEGNGEIWDRRRPFPTSLRCSPIRRGSGRFPSTGRRTSSGEARSSSGVRVCVLTTASSVGCRCRRSALAARRTTRRSVSAATGFRPRSSGRTVWATPGAVWWLGRAVIPDRSTSSVATTTRSPSR